ncbi:MAG: hypothetical protein ACYDCQ_13400 [Dehalococcoidia bacterium]
MNLLSRWLRRPVRAVVSDVPVAAENATYAGGMGGPDSLRAAIGGPSVHASSLGAMCSACRRPLESRTPPPGSMLRPVYAAVVCQLCSWIECKSCKGSPSDAPCTVCGSPVLPAQVAFFAAGSGPAHR